MSELQGKLKEEVLENQAAFLVLNCSQLKRKPMNLNNAMHHNVHYMFLKSKQS